jgi:hypothetical protein
MSLTTFNAERAENAEQSQAATKYTKERTGRWALRGDGRHNPLRALRTPRSNVGFFVIFVFLRAFVVSVCTKASRSGN